MYNFNLPLILVIVTTAILSLSISNNFVYGQTDGQVDLYITYDNGLRASPSNTELKIYQDSNDNLFREIELEDNPFTIPSLPLGHTYKIEVYVQDVFSNFEVFKLDSTSKNIQMTIPGTGGIQFTVLYNDKETPIVGAEIDLFTQKGEIMTEMKTYSDGHSPRIWIPITGLNPEDHFYADISIGENITKRVSPITVNDGTQEIRVITEWPSIFDKLFAVEIYESPFVKFKNQKGYFVEMYDYKGNFIDSSKLHPVGEAYFSNFPPNNYTFVLKQLEDTETKIIAEKQIALSGLENKAKIVLGYDKKDPDDSVIGYTIKPFSDDPPTIQPKEVRPSEEIVQTPETDGVSVEESIAETESSNGCNCVAFRFGNVQDYYLNQVQIALINLFDSQDTDLTIAITGDNIGDDELIVNLIKEKLENGNNLHLANKGWEFVDFTELTEQQQEESIRNTNNKIEELFGENSTIFIVPYNQFNDSTIEALRSNGMTYISSNLNSDIPPRSFDYSPPYHVPYTVDIRDVLPSETANNLDEQIIIIQNSLENYGYAIINFQSQDFAQTGGEELENLADLEKLEGLFSLIEELERKGFEIVPLEKIPKMNTPKESPQWVENIYLFYEQGRISHEDLTKAVNYLVSKNIIKLI